MPPTPSRLACLLGCIPALAWAAAPSVPAAPAPGAPPVELSPFVVSTSTDVGYAAENTLAGSRLNTRLRDTAGSVA
ncbi:MAG: hypothetical protein FJ397_13680, partial [Verrucomicrobia bacterium]|nr:hypothetical protein [Verrucomicrobiota bacterium]